MPINRVNQLQQLHIRGIHVNEARRRINLAAALIAHITNGTRVIHQVDNQLVDGQVLEVDVLCLVAGWHGCGGATLARGVLRILEAVGQVVLVLLQLDDRLQVRVALVHDPLHVGHEFGAKKVVELVDCLVVEDEGVVAVGGALLQLQLVAGVSEGGGGGG